LCGEHGVPIVPQGGNSGMSGGATPDSTGEAILLSLRRMNAIRRLDEQAGEVTCEAGVILQTLHEAAAAEGLRFPLTLGGKGSATIGGLISTNAGGTQVLRHGSMRAQVLGIEAVLADGSVFEALTPLKKDNRGFDLKQLLIGSEGTLGIITAATLKLLPALADRAVLWAGLASIGDARTLLLHAEKHAGSALEGFEVMPKDSFDKVLKHVPGARSPLQGEHAWHALIELAADKSSAEALPELARSLLESAFTDGLVEDATIAANEARPSSSGPCATRLPRRSARTARRCSMTSRCRSRPWPSSSRRRCRRSSNASRVPRRLLSVISATATCISMSSVPRAWCAANGSAPKGTPSAASSTTSSPSGAAPSAPSTASARSRSASSRA
jgi:FAD/FMN-containing dehydrogenase